MSTSTAVRIPFAAIVLAMLPAVLDQTILATALPTIAGDLGACPTSPGSSRPTSSPRPPRPRCGASSATATGASACSSSRSRCSSASAACGLAQDITFLVAARMSRAPPPAG